VQWFPRGISTYGGDIDGLFWLIFWIVGFWFVLVQGALVVFVVRYRRRSGRRAAYVAGDDGRQLAWVLVPAAIVLVLDLGIDAAGAPIWHHVKESMPAKAVRVRMVAKQFNWDVIYPGPDGAFETADDVRLENQLHVPAREDVLVTLTAADVIHSFFLPNVRVKQDVLPGRETNVWFNATEPGTYEIACAELCGFGHYTMKGIFTVHAADDYRAWQHATWPAAGGAAG
jgi:cytochrome c oxidase subunit 2